MVGTVDFRLSGLARVIGLCSGGMTLSYCTVIRQDGAILPAWDNCWVPQKNSPGSHIINPLLTNLVHSRWLDIGLVLF